MTRQPRRPSAPSARPQAVTAIASAFAPGGALGPSQLAGGPGVIEWLSQTVREALASRGYFPACPAMPPASGGFVSETHRSRCRTEPTRFLPLRPLQVNTAWAPRVCGDRRCDPPEEHPAFGRFGCLADCGAAAGVSAVLVRVRYDFSDLGAAAVSVAQRRARADRFLQLVVPRKRGWSHLAILPSCTCQLVVCALPCDGYGFSKREASTAEM